MHENAYITDNVLRRYLGMDEYNPQQPRDDNGRWTSGNKSVAVSKKRGKNKNRRKVLVLPTVEFRIVQQAFMTDVTNEQRKQKVLIKYIGNYRYKGILRADGTRDIVERKEI